MSFVPMRKAADILGLHPNTVRKLCDEGKIKCKKLESGHRRVDVSEFLREQERRSTTICYCRVSSSKQKDDLQRQVEYMQGRYPTAEIIKDIGSGVNYKRKGLKAILERSMRGEVIELVVAYKDRLARFGTDIVRQVLEFNGGKLVVLNEVLLSPEQELTKDLCSIIHVFSCRLHGLRKYKDCIKKDSSIPESRTESCSS
jgi:predicted site-specific integrase-resolvase